ncbi:hypothetical protein [Blastococcus sp. CT_GayMR20]|uniref:hypothetical protein n=1 Tax=Blastococcus sp. CT_GayMR20 TaxID=2559609 RepID=UPI001FD73713|nr:hypothetical protein [Blastococcus sp. CT_GayMR20]
MPWQARHALAAAPTTVAAYQIIDEFRLISAEDAETFAVYSYGGDSGNREYATAVENWLLGGQSQEQVLADLSAESAAQVQASWRSQQTQRGYEF